LPRPKDARIKPFTVFLKHFLVLHNELYPKTSSVA
jgi:hypothetical protein